MCSGLNVDSSITKNRRLQPCRLLRKSDGWRDVGRGEGNYTLGSYKSRPISRLEPYLIELSHLEPGTKYIPLIAPPSTHLEPHNNYAQLLAVIIIILTPPRHTFAPTQAVVGEDVYSA